MAPGKASTSKASFFKDLARSRSTHDTLGKKESSTRSYTVTSNHSRESEVEIPHSRKNSYQDERLRRSSNELERKISADSGSITNNIASSRSITSNIASSPQSMSNIATLAKNTKGFLTNLSGSRSLKKQVSSNTNTSSSPNLAGGITIGGASWGAKIMRKTSRMAKLKTSGGHSASSSSTSIDFLPDVPGSSASTPDDEDVFGRKKGTVKRANGSKNASINSLDRSSAAENLKNKRVASAEEEEEFYRSQTSLHLRLMSEAHHRPYSVRSEDRGYPNETSEFDDSEEESVRESIVEDPMTRRSVAREFIEGSAGRTEEEDEASDDDITALRKLSAALLSGDQIDIQNAMKAQQAPHDDR
jgi:hypothetical protein